MTYDITNQRFGKLTAQRYVHGGKWHCLCDCGKTTTVRTTMLVKKRTKSCGCLRRTFTRGNALPSGMAALNGLFAAYEARAKKRRYSFDLSLDEFQILTSRNCHYCGVAPQQVRKQGSCPTTYTYNGIDRIDNDLGYTFGNCFSCCRVCNQAKSDLSHAEFMAWLKRAYTHLNLGAKSATSTP
jgi:hypothetical protein